MSTRRDEFPAHMIEVTNKIFSIIMRSYVEVLHAIVEARQKKSRSANLNKGSLSIDVIPSPPPNSQTMSTRPSLTQWESGLELAQNAYEEFQKVPKDSEELEASATAALEILASSVRCLPRYSLFSSGFKPRGAKELDELAIDRVEAWHKQFFHLYHRNIVAKHV